MKNITLQTGVWYNDHSIQLTFPETWDITVLQPDLPDPLSEDEIHSRLNNPVNQEPLHKLAKGAKNPVVVIDDLARPTPIFRVMPFVLEEFRKAGISADRIRIVVATGTHGHQNRVGLAAKIGREANNTCRLIVHNYKKNVQYIGKTSFKTPVYVNKDVLQSDFICGIGGIYPQHTTGFGGGSKLSLGILGKKSIVNLHFGSHKSVGGTYNTDNSFRRDLDEIASMIGFSTMITLHTNSQLELVNLTCGDHFSYFSEAAAFSRNAYDAPLPLDADVVIANTYPSDVSYTFMRKGLKPLRCAPANSTKIAIAYNHEGVGEHGIFPQGKNPKLDRFRTLRLKISAMESKVIFHKILKQFSRPKNAPIDIHSDTDRSALPEKIDNFLLFRPPGADSIMPPIDGMRILNSWEAVLEEISRQHPHRDDLRVYIYPCSSLQCLDHLKLQEQEDENEHFTS